MATPPGWVMMGWPLVRARFWSNSLKPLVSERNMQMVMEGMTMGSLIRHRVFQGVEPSIWAASIRSSGTAWSPAI